MPHPHPAAARGPIVVVGLSGGLGASTLAAALAVSAGTVARPCLLLDLDVSGGGLDVTAGIEHQTGWRWTDLDVRGQLEPLALMGRLPGVPECRVLAGRGGAAEPPTDMAGIVRDLLRYPGPVIIDAPRRSPWAAQACTEAGRVVALAGTQPRHLADLVAWRPEMSEVSETLLILRGSARRLRSPLPTSPWGTPLPWRDDPYLRTGEDRGLWPGSPGTRGGLRALAAQVLRQLDREPTRQVA